MRRFIFAFLVIGFTDIIQVLLIREFIINFQGNELSLGVILANWMLLMALGSWQLGKLADRLPRRVPAFIVTQILVAVALPLEILFARSINMLVGIEPGEVVGLFPIFYCSLVVLTMGVGLHSLIMGSIDALHDISARWQGAGHNLVYYQNSVYGNVSIIQRDEQLNFYESGLPLFSVPDPI